MVVSSRSSSMSHSTPASFEVLDRKDVKRLFAGKSIKLAPANDLNPQKISRALRDLQSLYQNKALFVNHFAHSRNAAQRLFWFVHNNEDVLQVSVDPKKLRVLDRDDRSALAKILKTVSEEVKKEPRVAQSSRAYSQPKRLGRFVWSRLTQFDNKLADIDKTLAQARFGQKRVDSLIGKATDYLSGGKTLEANNKTVEATNLAQKRKGTIWSWLVPAMRNKHDPILYQISAQNADEEHVRVTLSSVKTHNKEINVPIIAHTLAESAPDHLFSPVVSAHLGTSAQARNKVVKMEEATFMLNKEEFAQLQGALAENNVDNAPIQDLLRKNLVGNGQKNKRNYTLSGTLNPIIVSELPILNKATRTISRLFRLPGFKFGPSMVLTGPSAKVQLKHKKETKVIQNATNITLQKQSSKNLTGQAAWKPNLNLNVASNLLDFYLPEGGRVIASPFLRFFQDVLVSRDIPLSFLGKGGAVKKGIKRAKPVENFTLSKDPKTGDFSQTLSYAFNAISRSPLSGFIDILEKDGVDAKELTELERSVSRRKDIKFNAVQIWQNNIPNKQNLSQVKETITRNDMVYLSQKNSGFLPKGKIITAPQCTRIYECTILDPQSSQTTLVQIRKEPGKKATYYTNL